MGNIEGNDIENLQHVHRDYPDPKTWTGDKVTKLGQELVQSSGSDLYGPKPTVVSAGKDDETKTEFANLLNKDIDSFGNTNPPEPVPDIKADDGILPIVRNGGEYKGWQSLHGGRGADYESGNGDQ